MERIMIESKSFRQIKELEWIIKLNTEMPQGLNTKNNLNVMWHMIVSF